MSIEDNFALASTGATIVDVSHEALHVASAASNLLLEREEMLWITSDAPQSVVIRVAPNHPPLTYVGWHVWHDYLSNPKIVEIASGVLPDCLTPAIVCNALPGAGTQLWELPNPIPPAHQFVRFTIQATFAPGPTYMNNVCLFAQHPGPKFSRSGAAGAAATLENGVGASRNTSISTSATSREHSRSYGATTAHTQQEGRGAAQPGAPSGSTQQAPISSLLRDLDEDIKALHPIRTVSPTRNVVFSAPSASLPSLVDAEIGEYLAAASRRSPSSTQQHPTSHTNATNTVAHENVSRVGQFGQGNSNIVAPRSTSPARDALMVVDNTTFRLAALEQAVTSLTRALENQRQDIVSIKELLAQRVAAQPVASVAKAHAKVHHAPQSTTAADIHFPEESLKAFIEDVLGPKLTKHAKRTEAKTLEKLEQHVSSMLDNVADVVDHRVRGYLNHLVGDHGMSALSRLRPEGAGDGRDYSGVSSYRRSGTDARSTEHSRDEDAYARPIKPSRHTPRW